ncbi:COMM domain-containing protein 2 [Holothuria leucospilota]|uniref:COMM domain-containing protein 2 n=1 Tax=Holothuria leucospilota TaxID=206669 RepID=A0A9Q1H367_HOLLE|nr:COMM domain-containing protein 2 [Holothuria leucospilota]
MLLILDEEHKSHLTYLIETDNGVVEEFGRIAMEFIRNGPNPKLYQSAAQKLDSDATKVRRAVEGLMHLLTEATRLELSEIDFQDSVITLGFSPEKKEHMLQLYIENRKEIKNILLEMCMDLPHYRNLEWRLDVEVASRSLRHQVVPSILMKLHTEDNGTKTTQVLQTDPVNLVHLTKSLEQALAEVKSQHCRRIIRNINK